MVKCKPRPVVRYSLLWASDKIQEFKDNYPESLDYDRGQYLVNTKRHGWQNVNSGDFLIFDENKRLLKVLKADDFYLNYEITEHDNQSNK